MPEVRHKPVIPHTVFKYNYLSIQIKNLCYFSISQLLILFAINNLSKPDSQQICSCTPSVTCTKGKKAQQLQTGFSSYLSLFFIICHVCKSPSFLLSVSEGCLLQVPTGTRSICIHFGGCESLYINGV